MIIIKHIRKTDAIVRKLTDNIQRWKLAVMILGLVGFSIGLAYLFQNLALRLPIHGFAWLAYLTVFLSSLAANLTIIVPVPIGLSILIAAATEWNPAMVALSASIGASIGELSGYLAGYLGRKVATTDSTVWRSRFVRWIQRWGAWAVFFLAFQPVLPFDVAGIIAGAARMPLRKFWPALWAGRFPKYLIFAYAGAQIMQHLPFFSK